MTALRQIRQVVGATLFTCLSAVLAISVVWTFLTGGANPFVKIVPTPVPIPGKRTDMQGGLVFPRWGTTAYGSADKNYVTGLTEIGKQTGAKWLELTFNLWQDDTTATNIYRTDSTTSPENLAAGIRAAHAAGFKVFVVPELTLTSGEWCGEIKFSDPLLAKQWFTNYLQALTPYLQAATTTGAEQFALGNEYENLEKEPPALWNTFIDAASALYPGALVYDFNFTSRWSVPYSWMKNPHLAFLGVSEYQDISPQGPSTMTVQQIEVQWQANLLPELDRIAQQTGKQLLVTEIGYRDASDALYQPYTHTTNAPPDPSLQAAAYEAALIEIYTDRHFAGIYFWAWSLPPFEPNWQPSAQILRAWYANDAPPPPCNAVLPLLQC
jgi:hypothetical protein